MLAENSQDNEEILEILENANIGLSIQHHSNLT